VLKKTIKYVDFNGDEVSEDFFFHLSKAELVELEMSHEGGLSESLKRIVEAEDNKSIIKEFKNIIMSSYGKRSHDGKRFIKNQDVREEFASTEAYSALFMELVTDTNAAVEFINGVIPAGMAEEAAQATEGVLKTDGGPAVRVLEQPEATVVSKTELDAMSKEDLQALTARIATGEVVLGD